MNIRRFKALKKRFDVAIIAFSRKHPPILLTVKNLDTKTTTGNRATQPDHLDYREDFFMTIPLFDGGSVRI